MNEQPVSRGGVEIDGSAAVEVRALARRIAAGVWVVMLGTGSALAFDVLYVRSIAFYPIAFEVVQIITGAVLLAQLQRRQRMGEVVLIGLLLCLLACITIIATGLLGGQHRTIPLALLALCFGAAGIFRWDWRAQLMVVLAAIASFAFTVWYVAGTLAAYGYAEAATTVIALAVSMWANWVGHGERRRRTEAERERRAWEQRLLEIERNETSVATALAHVSRAMLSAPRLTDVMDRLCRMTCELLGAERASTWMVVPEEDSIVLAAQFSADGVVRDWVAGIRFPMSTFRPWFESPGDLPVLVLSREDLEQRPDGAAALASGVQRIVLLGLESRGTSFGFHAAAWYDRPPPAWTPVQRRIALGLAQIGSLAIDNARLFEQLTQANRIKSDFVATMSHELRTPLNVILGYNELLLDGTFGPLSAEQSDTLNRIQGHSYRLLEMINDTLDLSRLENGEVDVEMSEVDLAVLLGQLDAETRELQQRSPAEVRWRVAADLPVVHTDAGKLKVIIKNLFHNALKFTHEGTVEVAAQSVDAGVEIAVRDTGIGIAPEAQKLIFEPFRQADGDLSRHFGGAGLGLYIVQRLVEVLGGSVELESTPGVGSTFRVRLAAS